MMRKIYVLLSFLLLSFGLTHAQNDNGAIKVTLQDKNTKEAIPFANVVAYKDGVQVGVATTNMDGEAFIKPLAPGKYTVKGIYVGYQATEIKDIVVGEGKTAYVVVGLSNGEGVKLDEVVVETYLVPLVDPDTKSGQTVTREDYQNLATKDVNSVAATTAGVYQADEGRGLNIRGGRGSNATYFVDGVKVIGGLSLPQQSIEQLNVITGGIPANYGDLTSGAISISTRGPQSKFFGGLELITSKYLDKFNYNSLGFSFGGPLYKLKDSTRRTVLGFFISGQGNYIQEPSPSFIPIWRVTDEKLDELKKNPLRPSSSGTGFVRSSEFVTKNDMQEQAIRENAVARSIALNGKLDFSPSANTNMVFGGAYEFSESMGAGVGNQMFNWENNSKSTSRTFRTNFSITQKFGNAKTDKSKSQSLISNAYFKFLGSYENLFSHSFSATHGDNFFNYGYIGEFKRNFLEQDWAYNYNFTSDFKYNGQSINSYTYTGRTEMPLTFTGGTLNPDATAYTQALLALTTNTFLHSMNYIQGNNGLLNGQTPQSIYSLFNNFGLYPTGNSISQFQQFRIASSFNADIKNHAISVGMEFDQRWSSFHGVAATALWTRMRQLANTHTEQLDLENPVLNENLSGLIPYYYFNYLYQADKQTQFSEKFLELIAQKNPKAGFDKSYTGFINIDNLEQYGLKPEDLSLDMFSAEDLLGNQDATNLVSYSGYSHDRKTLSLQKTNINDFLTKTDENGRKLLPIGSFVPLYSAVYVMDKFDFKDIKFLVGLRVDRYDANQPVLVDKYALHQIAGVKDLASMSLPQNFSQNIPAQMTASNAAVYVAQNPAGNKSPVAIKGYRVGDRWFNAEGTEISDPNLIASSDGRPIPLYKTNADYNEKMSANAFTDYVAAVIPMPRIGFSFPISDVANFFAHYDKLSQRPTNSAISPLDYYFMNASSTTPLITNPNQRPQLTTDYELGFSQVLNERKNASITISSFYKENRNLINQRIVVGAYPKNYIMYDNIDFSTVKGLSFAFDFRRTGGSRINFNYTLQFAEGSGSNANSGANLASSGQPNIRILQPLDFDQRHSLVLNYDYRFGSKKDYKGPSFTTEAGKTLQFLSDVGFNLSFLLGSGTPYTRWNTAIPLNGNARSSIIGQINGSSKPWAFRTNLRIDKNVPLTWGKEDDENKKRANLNIYLQVLNLFNTKNVLGVYNYTGAPDDDGYLTSVQAQAALALANSVQAFTDMYNIRMNTPGNYSLPRQIRLGLLFEF